jgi:hypothetical protein
MRLRFPRKDNDGTAKLYVIEIRRIAKGVPDGLLLGSATVEATSYEGAQLLARERFVPEPELEWVSVERIR